ncbi:MAG: dTDP-4-dehydrorhamnose 3,5-epimerase [Myxococcota bacterium]|nr:dTDP-4-dehydrorhamnose 3,5-epimerase [Myxococcota bacterium]
MADASLNPLTFSPRPIPGLVLITPRVHRDPRGFFLETYNASAYGEKGLKASFVQDNFSQSTFGTIRGLHAQLTHPQGKLISVTEGEIFDVAVDIRVGSPTYGQWDGVRLSAESFQQFYIPPGFAHGFCVLSPQAKVAYKVTDFYDASDELVIAWNDPDLGIEWPVTEPILSERDRQAPRLSEHRARLSAQQPDTTP